MEEARPRRTWGVSEQKIVGARQDWKCAHCECLLPPSYEVDHVKPLWEGGADCINTNAEALCNNCHGRKTQLESIRRRDDYRERRDNAIAAAKLKAGEADTPTVSAKKPRLEDQWRANEAFIVDNPFLKYAFMPPARHAAAGETKEQPA